MSRAGRPAAEGAPAVGALEELDGTPIRVPGVAGVSEAPPRRPAIQPWWRAALAATTLTVRRPGLWPAALVAFLARGGLLLLGLPIVVLPTLLGISNFVGPASVTASGPAPRLVAIIAGGVAGVVALAVVGTAVAAAAEATFLRASVVATGSGDAWRRLAAAARVGASGAAHGVRLAAVRVVAIRLTLLVPVAAAIAVALPGWIEVAYRELTLPTDVAAPLLLRVLAGAPAATALVAGAWLGGEVVGGFAARRAVLLDRPWPRALGGALLLVVRAPGGTLLTTAAAVAGSVLLLAPALWLLAASWDLVRRPLVDEGASPAAVGGSLLLAAAWLVALGLAAAAAAWRGSLATAELLRHAPDEPARHAAPRPSVP